MRDGLIYYKDCVYVPNILNLIREIIDHFHNSKEGGHSGWLRTYIRIKSFRKGIKNFGKELKR